MPLLKISIEIEVVINLPPLWLYVFKCTVHLNRFGFASRYRANCKNSLAFRVAGDAPLVYFNNPERGAQGAHDCREMFWVAWLAVWLFVCPSVLVGRFAASSSPLALTSGRIFVRRSVKALMQHIDFQKLHRLQCRLKTDSFRLYQTS